MKHLNRPGVIVAVLVTAAVGGLLSTAPLQAQAPADPFALPDTFCVRHDPPAGRRNSSSPGVTPNSITIVDQSADHLPIRRLGFDVSPFAEYNKAFIDEINERCGGINGRKLIYRKAQGNGLAPDPAAHAQALCIKIAEDYKAFLAFGQGSLVPTTACLTQRYKTIMLPGQPGTGTAADYARAQGRLASIYPPEDTVAKTVIDYGVKRSWFKGKKVAVLAIQSSATSVKSAQENYVDNLEKVGIDADLRVLPCVGTACAQQMGATVARMRAAGTNLIVLAGTVQAANIGGLFKSMAEMNYRARVVGPYAATNDNDSVQNTLLAAAGRAGAEWGNGVGKTALAVVPFDVMGGWRVGVKETPFGKMCTEVVARHLKEPQLTMTERNLNNGRWQAATFACAYVRAFAKALYSLGATVNTERMAAALAKVTVDRRDTTPVLREKFYYSGRDVTPTKGVEIKMLFPCTLNSNPNIVCNIPADRPLRVRDL